MRLSKLGLILLPIISTAVASNYNHSGVYSAHSVGYNKADGSTYLGRGNVYHHHEQNDGHELDYVNEPPFIIQPIRFNGRAWFDTDKAILKPSAKQELSNFAKYLNTEASRADLSSIDIRIIGHTDSRASDAYNMNLSKKRAKAVADYLILQGVNQTIYAKGVGERQPVATNKTAAGRQANRRVEVYVAGGSNINVVEAR